MPDAAALVRRYWGRMNDNDWAAAAELFSDDFVLVWPQSGEAIRSRPDFAAINANYPAAGRWVFTIRKFIASATSVATEVHVTDSAVEAVAVTFFECDGERLSRITEYWPDPFPAPDWRKGWVTQSGGITGQSKG